MKSGKLYSMFLVLGFEHLDFRILLSGGIKILNFKVQILKLGVCLQSDNTFNFKLSV